MLSQLDMRAPPCPVDPLVTRASYDHSVTGRHVVITAASGRSLCVGQSSCVHYTGGEGYGGQLMRMLREGQ